MLRTTLFLLIISSASALKFLCYSPRFAQSHSNYLSKLSDSLIDAGHEVVILAPTLVPSVRGESKRARIIEYLLPGLQEAYEEGNNEEALKILWQKGEAWEALGEWRQMMPVLVSLCNETLNRPGLLEQLRAEKFDAAFGESIDWCLGGLLHLLGIEKFAISESIAYKDGLFPISQLPASPSYVPSIMGGSFGDEMTLFQRAFNVFNLYMLGGYNFYPIKLYQEMFEANFAGFPDIVELTANNSLYFLNSDPLVDFPRPSSARIIDLGGIAVSNGYQKLDEKWSSIFDLRPKTVLISLGTYVQSYAMPEDFKNSIRETVKTFTDVTFIWKYEKPEHNVSQGVPNLIEATWLPQNDMLRDPRLSLFITHCGQGSTTEANYAGVPLVVIPNIFDQVRNAFAMRRAGLGLNLHKSQLGDQNLFEKTVREVLENPEYKNRAMKTAAMLNSKPFSARETFVRNMEFLAKHGPLRQLDHYGRHLNFFQFYLVDVVAAVVLSVTVGISIVAFITLKVLRRLLSSLKAKRD